MLLAEGAGSGSPMVVRQPYQKIPFAGPVQAAHGDPVFPHKKKPKPKSFRRAARRGRAVSVEHNRVLSSSCQPLLYRLEVVVIDLSFEPFHLELQVELSVALRRDLPASNGGLRLRVDERSDCVQ